MAYEIKHLDSSTVTGKQYSLEFPINPESADDTADLQKKILPTDEGVIRAIVKIDKKDSDTFHYLVSSTDGDKTFEIPAGDYAVSERSFHSISDITGAISASYAEIETDNDYEISKNYNISDIDFPNQLVVISLPVKKG